MTFSLAVLVGGWAAIVYFSIKENAIADYLNKFHSLLGSWGPTFLITAVNYVIPWILAKITQFEDWDFSSTQIKHEVWRTYLSAILNNVIFALI